MTLIDRTIRELNARITESLRQWYLTIPMVLVVLGVLVPLFYLVFRAFQADPVTLVDIVFRYRNAVLLGKTLALTAGVLVGTSLLALPYAWLTARTNLPARGLMTLVGVLPLAVPGYVMAYVLMATTGQSGTLARQFGLFIPRLNGYAGSLIALTLTTFPYLFLNLRTAFLGMDTSLEESARSLGAGRVRLFTSVILPQLKPAFWAGGLLVGLHVLGDFGVVSLMRFETFSYALFLQYTASYDRIYAAWLALILLLLTGLALVLEAIVLKGTVFHPAGSGSGSNRGSRLRLGRWKWPAFCYCALVGLVSVGIPVWTVGWWMGMPEFLDSGLIEAAWNSMSVAIPAAMLGGALALPVAYLGVRNDDTVSRVLERVAYLGYATPRLALALAVIVLVLAVFPGFYQTLGLLIIVYALHFMAEAIGPIRSTFYQISPHLKEAARSLGSGPFHRFATVIFPLARRGLLVGVSFVFLSTIKDLPLALLLSPPGFQTLATSTWSFAEEAMFAPAAPYALTIMACSACFVGLLLHRQKNSR